MRFIAVLLVVVFVGCDRGAVRPVLGNVELSARSLHFDLTFVGFPTARSLVLRNGSRSDRAVTLSTTGPFSTALELNVPCITNMQSADAAVHAIAVLQGASMGVKPLQAHYETLPYKISLKA